MKKKQNPLPTPKRRYKTGNLVPTPRIRIPAPLLKRVDAAKKADGINHTTFTERAFELYLKTLGL